ncbi:MAG: sodium:proton antiporter [bacterium]
MAEELLIGLASIVVLGVLAQWIAWRVHLPAILLLLIFGFAAGPGFGILHPDEIFGDLLFPLVSASVAIILFEGGLSLKIAELRKVGHVVRNLTTTAILVTWVLAALGAYYIVGIEIGPAILLGAILVVSGPTVIIPLLRQIRPTGNVGSIVKWEGIVNDPIGAILAVLVFEVLLAGGIGEGTTVAILGVAKAAIFGTLIGFAAAVVVVLLLRRYLIPDFLQNPVALMLVIVAFAAANALQPESGLLAVTVMGIVLANQKYVSVHHIVEFKETLRVLLISSLFIILAARLTSDQLALFSLQNWLFVALLIVVVRPVAVWLSTMKNDITWRERLFLAWMAPRGIVAAAVISVFAIQLNNTGYPNCDCLVPLAFQVIIGTVAIYGLTAPWLARWLKLSQPNPQGVLFAGAQSWAQDMARALRDENFPVVLVDSNWANITGARGAGCRAYYENILSESLLADIQLDGIGRLVALTPNDEVNSLAALRFANIFGRSEIYQLPARAGREGHSDKEMPKHLRGRHLFDEKANFAYLLSRFQAGAVVKKTSITEEFPYSKFLQTYGDEVLPLFVISSSRNLQICTANAKAEPQAGDTIVALVDERS